MSKLQMDSLITNECDYLVTTHNKEKWRRSNRRWKSQCKQRNREKIAKTEGYYSCYYVATWRCITEKHYDEPYEYTVGYGNPVYVYEEFEKEYINQRGEIEKITIRGLFADNLVRGNKRVGYRKSYHKVDIPKEKQYLRRGSSNGRNGKQMKNYHYYYTKRMNKYAREMWNSPCKGRWYRKVS